VSTFLHQFEVAAPLFVLVLAGYLLASSGRWPKAVSDGLSKFVFAVAVPALLFSLMRRLLQAAAGRCAPADRPTSVAA